MAESRQVPQGTLQALKAQAEEAQRRLEQFELAEQQREASREQARRAAEAHVTASVEATERALLEAQNRQATLAGQAEAARQSHVRTAERLREVTESNLELTAGAARDRAAGHRLRDELDTARADRTSYSKAWAEGHAESEAKLAMLMEEIRSVRSEHQEAEAAVQARDKTLATLMNQGPRSKPAVGPPTTWTPRLRPSTVSVSGPTAAPGSGTAGAAGGAVGPMTPPGSWEVTGSPATSQGQSADSGVAATAPDPGEERVMAKVDERVTEIRKEVVSLKGGLETLTALVQKWVGQTTATAGKTAEPAVAASESMPTVKSPPVSLGPPVAPGKATSPHPFTALIPKGPPPRSPPPTELGRDLPAGVTVTCDSA
ncbi:MAG: hypothetical protein VXX04_03150, partial [Actinomycetota bacterium]|nr:hypothetical protein [Actinomycetota bacterium]